MNTAVAATSMLVGLGLWIWAVKMYLDDPGYGGFDMNTAPAFDFRWLKGTVFLAVGVGLIAKSWLIGLATFLCGTAVTFLVKPVLGTFATRRIANATSAREATYSPGGIKALSHAERSLKTGNETDTP